MAEIPINRADRPRPWLLASALPLLALLSFVRPSGDEAILISLGLAVAVFFLAIWAYYALARVTLAGDYWPLGAAALTALVVGGTVTEWSMIWHMVTGLAMALGGGVAIGYLTARGKSPQNTYIIGALVVVVLFTAQFGSIWSQLIDSASAASEAAVTELNRMMVTFGYSEQQIIENSDAMKRMFGFVIGLMPALTILSSLVQFTLGYLLFSWWADCYRPELGLAIRFDRWRVPFNFTPLLILAIGAHALGNETIVLVGRNILAIMAVYYGAAGLALVGYYLKKLHLSLGMKIMFYVLLFLTQMVGFAIAAILGFLDSFFDWRLRSKLREQAEG